MESAFWQEIDLHHDHELPIYKQLSNCVENMIDQGILKPGTRLPSERKWASYLNISRMTVTLAKEDMKLKGIIRTQPGSGTFVMRGPRLERVFTKSDWQSRFALDINRMNRGFDLIMKQKQNQETIQLAREDIHASNHLREAIRSRMITYLQKEDVAMQSQIPIEGNLQFRKTMCKWLEERDIHSRYQEMLIVSSVMQGLDLISHLFLQQGDYVIMEEPGPQEAADLFQASGAEILRITLDGEGMKLRNLEQLMRNFPIKFIYLNPTFHNPTGLTMSKKRKEGLIALAKKYQILIVENDETGMLYYDKKPVSPLKSMNTSGVIYLTSLSHYLYPEIQLAAIVAQEAITANLTIIKRRTDPSCNNVLQAAVESFIADGELARHIIYLREVYKKKVSLVRDKFSESSIVSCCIPDGGIYVWCKLESGLSSEKLLKLEPAISFVPGNWLSGTGMFENYFRISITAPSFNQLEEALMKIVSIVNREVIYE